MNTPWKIIAEMASNDSRLVKESIVTREATAKNNEFFKGLNLALNPLVTFGVKQVPVREGNDGPGIAWVTFEVLTQKLIDRVLTGHAARDAIEDVMEHATNEQWNVWFRGILIKDLKANFSESTVNRVCKKLFPQYEIEVFECQLAKDCVDEFGNVDPEEMAGKKIIDTKLDGMRVLTIAYPSGKVDQFSRNGRELVNFTVIKDQVSKSVSSFSEPMVLDAEVMSKNFQDLMRQARRKTDVQADDSTLNLIDIIPLREFLSGKGTVKQLDRTQQLHKWYAENADAMPNVSVLGYEIIDLSTTEGDTRLSEINKAALAAGAEGIMLKDPDAVYECKRSKNWLKMKPFIEESLKVTSIEEGKADGKFVGTMGALVCEGIVDGKRVKVNVGGGFSIGIRAQIWADFIGAPVSWQKKVKKQWVTITEQPAGTNCIGMIAEVRADCLTKSDDNTEWSMRFPRWKRWRGFVAGEKI